MRGKTFQSSNILLLLIMFIQSGFVEVGIRVLLPPLPGDHLLLLWGLFLIKVPENLRVDLLKRVGRAATQIDRVTLGMMSGLVPLARVGSGLRTQAKLASASILQSHQLWGGSTLLLHLLTLLSKLAFLPLLWGSCPGSPWDHLRWSQR